MHKGRFTKVRMASPEIQFDHARRCKTHNGNVTHLIQQYQWKIKWFVFPYDINQSISTHSVIGSSPVFKTYSNPTRRYYLIVGRPSKEGSLKTTARHGPYCRPLLVAIHSERRAFQRSDWRSGHRTNKWSLSKSERKVEVSAGARKSGSGSSSA